MTPSATTWQTGTAQGRPSRPVVVTRTTFSRVTNLRSGPVRLRFMARPPLDGAYGTMRAGADGREVSMNARVQLGLAIPQTFLQGPVDERRLREFLTRADTLGFHSVWVGEQMLGTIPRLEPVTLLTWAAALTQRLRLGSAVLLTALPSALHLAKSLATLDQLSAGRLIVGVGLGGDPKIYPAFGLDPKRRAARFAEGIRLMKQLWTEPRVSFAGEFWRLDGAAMEPKPLQKPHPPVWFGAHHPNALRRTVDMGDGFMGAGSIACDAFAEEVKRLRGLLADA